MPIDELVGAPPTGDPRVHLRPVRRGGMTYVPLTRRPGGTQAYKLILAPGRCGGEPQSHEGYEWLYVLNGRLRLVLGDQELVFVDPEDVEAIGAGLQRLLDDSALRARLSAVGRDRAAGFTWERSADLTRKVLRAIAA